MGRVTTLLSCRLIHMQGVMCVHVGVAACSSTLLDSFCMTMPLVSFLSSYPLRFVVVCLTLLLVARPVVCLVGHSFRL
ncbi:hypothetical protein EV126DRAFT_408421 [Verticillium dahliae]|nr:hypothetical protein EV126DRAFT_408421 [Verticillium dahliae]